MKAFAYQGRVARFFFFFSDYPITSCCFSMSQNIRREWCVVIKRVEKKKHLRDRENHVQDSWPNELSLSMHIKRGQMLTPLHCSGSENMV